MKPRSGSRTLGDDPRPRSAQNCRRDNQDDIRLPEYLAEDDRKTRECETRQVNHALQTRRSGGYPQWTAPHPDGQASLASQCLALKTNCRVRLRYLPCRIIRRRRNYADLVAVIRKPLSHLSRVLSRTGQFRREVDAVYQYFQFVDYVSTTELIADARTDWHATVRSAITASRPPGYSRSETPARYRGRRACPAPFARNCRALGSPALDFGRARNPHRKTLETDPCA